MPNLSSAGRGSTFSWLRMKSTAEGDRGGLGSIDNKPADELYERYGKVNLDARLAHDVLNGASELVERKGFGTTQVVGLVYSSRGDRRLRCNPGDIENRDRLDRRPAIAYHRDKRKIAGKPDDPVQASVFRTVDPGGAQDEVFHSALADSILGHLPGRNP